MIQNTILEINLEKLKHNYRFFKEKIGKKTKIIPIIKASAYGSDSSAIAKTLEEEGVEIFAVAYLKEAITLKKAGITKSIIILYPQPGEIKQIIEWQFEPVLYNDYLWNIFNKIYKHKKKYPIHLEVNIGMNRIGFNFEALQLFLKKAHLFPIKIKTIFAHLSNANEIEGKEKTQRQIQFFQKIKQYCKTNFRLHADYHLLNTSGTLFYTATKYQWVRCGIGLYGFANYSQWDKYLQPIAQLKTIIIQIISIEKGESVGYSDGFIASKKTKIATLPIGYADGIDRNYGKKGGIVIIKKQKATIIGNICMDLMMIDITHIKCQEGDEVEIFGTQQSAIKVAQTNNTIAYEVLVKVAPRIKRVFVK